MRLLLDWIQLHPALPRVQAHTAVAADAQNFDVGRPYFPAHGGAESVVDIPSLEARMAASPPRSLAEFYALVAAEVSEDEGVHVAAQERRPDPEPEPVPEGAEPPMPGNPAAFATAMDKAVEKRATP